MPMNDTPKEKESILSQDKTVLTLCDAIDKTDGDMPASTGRLPSVMRLGEIVKLVRECLFPAFFDDNPVSSHMLPHFIAVKIDKLRHELSHQIYRACRLALKEDLSDDIDISKKAAMSAENFISQLPEIRQLLLSDVNAMFVNDPAATNKSEVIFCYPAFTGMLHYRMAHALLKMGVPLLPRIITEMAHSRTGIDIHPGAQIGSHFSIDHGTGVVIGETCVIGHHVRIYQGVTLGAKNFVLDDDGHPVNIPRHPILEDYVTVYSNATILGRVTIGHNAVIGGNIWVTHDVSPYSRLVQRPSAEAHFIHGAGI